MCLLMLEWDHDQFSFHNRVHANRRYRSFALEIRALADRLSWRPLSFLEWRPSRFCVLLVIYFWILVQEWRMAERPIAPMLTLGVRIASPTAFLIVLIYA